MLAFFVSAAIGCQAAIYQSVRISSPSLATYACMSSIGRVATPASAAALATAGAMRKIRRVSNGFGMMY